MLRNGLVDGVIELIITVKKFRNTQMNHEFKPNEFSSNGRLGNINLSGTSGACWSSELVEMLQSNMKKNMKLFKHNLVFAN